MLARALRGAIGDLYDTDISLWSQRQAELLHRHAAIARANDAIDWPHIIEEIGGLGVAERSALASHIRTIIEHLARLQASPAIEPRHGWLETIIRTRDRVEDVLHSSPSLRPAALAEVVAAEHPRALRSVDRVLALYGETPWGADRAAPLYSRTGDGRSVSG